MKGVPMTRDEAVRELVRLLPALLGEDVVVIPSTLFSSIKYEVASLGDELEAAQSSLSNAQSEAESARMSIENVESYLSDVPDLDDIETRLRSLLEEVEEA
jgi:F420-0:gamma-glutamyl ligase